MSQWRPLIPRTRGASSPQRAISTRQRSGRAVVACEHCRAKKIACDNTRPVCNGCIHRNVECHYPTLDGSETRHQALLREHKVLSDLVEHLCTVPAATAQALLYELRQTTDPLSVLRRYENGQLMQGPSELGVIQSALPDIQSETELKLMVQQPLAYPAVNLSYKSIMTKNTLVASPDVLAAAEGLSSLAQSSYTSSRDDAASRGTQQDKDDPDPKQKGSSEPPTGTPRYLSALETHLHIDYWTSVPTTNRYAAGAIAHYLETEHPMLRLFDPETFLNDLLQNNSDFCSPFLVNSLLAIASQTYAKQDSTALIKSLEFEDEARMLWRADHADSIPNLAGLLFLYIAMVNNGNGHQGAGNYVFEAGKMAERMKVFDVLDNVATSHSQLQSEEAQYALRQVSWGFYNVYNLSVHFWIAQPLEHPPALLPPDKPDAVRFDDTLQRFVRATGEVTPDDEAFMYLCEICRVDSSALILLRDPALSRPPPLAFMFSKYQELLDIMGSIPQSLRRGGKVSAAVLLLHMYFHRCVMDLFRPYITRDTAKLPQKRHLGFGSPEAIFYASTQQLKGLLIDYTVYPHFASCLMWHPTLLYIANSVIECPSNPDWRFFFLLCVHCYSALYDSYPFAESAIQSLLGHACELKTISASDMSNIIETTLDRRKQRKKKARVPQGTHGRGNLRLEMSAHEAEAAALVTEKFLGLSLFDQFAVDVLRGAKAQRDL